MSAGTRYAMLMTSLPNARSLFDATETPISRIRLDQRLSLLDEQDAAVLATIEHVLQWDHLPMDRTDEQFLDLAEELLSQLNSPLLRELVEKRLQLRTVMAALRRRGRGETAPEPGAKWGWGELAEHIRRNWTRPRFALGGTRPWISDAERLMEEGDTMEVERLLLWLVWDQIERASFGHYFDFEAVVLYVMRWNAIHRWVNQNADAAVKRFNAMTEKGLRFAHLFAEPTAEAENAEEVTS